MFPVKKEAAAHRIIEARLPFPYKQEVKNIHKRLSKKDSKTSPDYGKIDLEEYRLTIGFNL